MTMKQAASSFISGQLGSITILELGNNFISLLVAVVSLIPTYLAWKDRQKNKSNNN